jgi:hypothetical protein
MNREMKTKHIRPEISYLSFFLSFPFCPLMS